VAATVTFLLACLAAIVLIGVFSGCAPTSTSDRLRKVEVQLTIINRAADAIDAKVEEARGTNNAALVIVSTAATRPTVPPETQADLNHATDQMKKTDATLAKVPGDTRVIRGGAEDQAGTAKDAIKGEDKAKTELKEEKNHWLGYKTRMTLWVLLALLPVFAVVVFAVKVAGGGPLLEVVGEVTANFFRLLGRGIRAILTSIFHLGSLGAAKLANKVNQRWEAGQLATGSKPAPAVVAAPKHETPPK
jgi:hypothetical protein